MIELESSAGLAPTVAELERFDVLLREEPGVIGLCSRRSLETQSITATFMVSTGAPNDVIEIASRAFTTALNAAGFDGKIERLELEAADEPLFAVA